MGLLGAYFQDIQFQQGGVPTVTTTSGTFRASFSRNAIITNIASSTKTQQFIGGAITTGWMSTQFIWGTSSGGSTQTSKRFAGFGQFSSSNSLVVGTDTSTSNKFALHKYNGTTLTQLASESGTSLVNFNLYRIDMQVINYGASATVNVYLNGVLIITFTGDVTVSGMSNMDCLVFGPGSNTSTQSVVVSEAMVTTDDVRSYIGLQTLALTGAGTTTNWSNNTFSNINGTSYSDANPIYSNTNSQVQEYNITDPISPGSFTYVGVVQAVRAAKSITAPSVTKIGLGYLNVNQSLGPSYGSNITLTTVPTCYEQIDLVDPTTGVAFVQADMTAEQLAVKAVT